MSNEQRKASILFKREKIFLDNACGLHEYSQSSFFDFAFKAVWVINASNKDAEIFLRFNQGYDNGDSLPARLNTRQNFSEKVINMKAHWEAQSGKWIELLFAMESSFDSDVALDTSSNNSLSDGSNFNHDNFSLDENSTLILPADDQRVVTTVINNSAEPIYFGTDANLNHADFKKKCPKILGNGGELKWRNQAGLYARFELVAHASDEIIIFNEVL